jgi:hypothetical protein
VPQEEVKKKVITPVKPKIDLNAKVFQALRDEFGKISTTTKIAHIPEKPGEQKLGATVNTSGKKIEPSTNAKT